MEYGIVIGRFQPYHMAHHALMHHALSKYDKVIVVLGSANLASNIKNPWSFADREYMIRKNFNTLENARLQFIGSKDYFYSDELWKTYIVTQINAITGVTPKILVGAKSDNTSWYLDAFPEWGLDTFKQIYPFHATNIREMYFRGNKDWRKYTAPMTEFFLEDFAETTEFTRLCDEQAFVDKYKMDWASSPFKPVFVTVDNVIVKSGHVLVVRRKGQPGKGLIALPGGFVNQDETLLDANVRELREETGIKIAKDILRASIRATKVFDYPYRSLRGRTITHGYYINLGFTGALPEVKGGDDAAHAFWMPLAEVEEKETSFFEDHAEIIRYFVS